MSKNNITIENYLLGKYDNKSGYIQKYSGSIFITVLTILGFSVAFGYNYLQSELKFLKKNWNIIKCNPLFMPFAGLINAPVGKSKMGYTEENLNNCMFDVLSDVVEAEKASQSAAVGIANESAKGMNEALNAGRSLVKEVRASVANVFSGVFSKMHNVLIPMQNMMKKSKNNINNSQAVLTTTMNTGVGSMLSFRSFLSFFITAVIVFMILMIGTFTAALLTGSNLAIIPIVGWGLSIPVFAFAVLTILFIIVIVMIFIPLSTVIEEILSNTQKIVDST